MATANCVMVAVMTMTPLHLRDHGGSLEMVGLVMSVHVAGMYVFAPLLGTMADRRGALPTARVATALLVASALLAATPGHNHAVIGVALTMLGLGWSMATISGAALLVAAVPSEEGARTQGVADMTMGLAGGAGGTASGIVVGSVGYATLSLIGAVVAGAVFAALFTQRAHQPFTPVTGGNLPGVDPDRPGPKAGPLSRPSRRVGTGLLGDVHRRVGLAEEHARRARRRPGHANAGGDRDDDAVDDGRPVQLS